MFAWQKKPFPNYRLTNKAKREKRLIKIKKIKRKEYRKLILR